MNNGKSTSSSTFELGPRLFAIGTLVCIVLTACSSSKTDTTPAPTPTTASAVSGAQDTHCAGKPTVTTKEAACKQAPATEDAGTKGDAGAAPKSDYGDTLYNSEGDDDDCKYHVKWTSTAATINTDVTFVLVGTKKADNAVLAGAATEVEVFLDETHPAPNSGVKTTETTPGTYSIGPVRFDAAGKWTVRFHFFDSCNDNEESPHGHAAFFVNVK